MKNNQAFTLIELLVVVLIIGILAAVAVPQYTQAVEKSRYAAYRLLANSLAQAAKAGYLANGTWPSSLDTLDIDLPADMNTETSIAHGICKTNNKMFCCIIFPAVGYSGSVWCGDNKYHLLHGAMYADFYGVPSDSFACNAKEEKYKNVCKSVSGGATPIKTSISTPDGWKGDYSQYKY